MAEAIVSMVVGRITDLLSEEAQVLHGVKDEVEQVVAELMRMKTFLPDVDSRLDEDKIRILLREVRDLAYDAEHVVETFLVKASSSERKRRKQENKYRIKITDVLRKMSVIYDRFRDCNIKPTSEAPDSSPGKLKRFHSFTTVEPEIFVGFQGDVDRLVGHLVDETDDSYRLISICGMGGLGKTTLAQKIYNHSTIKNHFAGLAWVSISQQCQAKLVLQRILICLVHERKEEILKMDDDKLVENLQQIQQKKKCLIVLDDIWSTGAWDSIKLAFTVEKSISKFMLTSRHVNVAEYVNPKGLIHLSQSLNEDQSWQLLEAKAIPTRGDYLDIARDFKTMEKLGREMLKNCAGLPLAIVILGGTLVTKPALAEWEKVYNDSLSSLKKGKRLGENQQEELLNILARSYNDLPSQLKACFLYLGKFREDEWIDAENLYQLWIAEGMVLSSDKREGETMMQVAESYMGELVHRSMVQVRCENLESSSTKFKSCSLHDLMRDLSLLKAKEEDFFKAIDFQEGNSVHPSMFAYTRQLVVHWDDDKYGRKKARSYIFKKPNHQQYRSMLLMNGGECESLKPVLGLHFANFRLLRVLSLDNVRLDRQTVSGSRFGTSLGRVIGSLIYLRYLSARNSNLMILPWIQNLVLLQTLKLERYYQSSADIPKSINILGKLAHLRHLYLPNWDFSESEKNVKLRFNGLRKLETLENFNTLGCEIKDLQKLTNLKRLSVKCYSEDVEEMIKSLATLALSSTSGLRYLALRLDIKDQVFPSDPKVIRQLFWNDKFNLEELSIDGKLPAELGELFEQQQHLNNTHIDASLIRITKLTLSSSYLKIDPMPLLEKIPTLRDLYLGYEAYMGKEMVCSAMGFPKLTRLQLFRLSNLEKWRVEEGSMPILSELTIYRCDQLEELPEGFRFLDSLQTVKLDSKLCDSISKVNGEKGSQLFRVITFLITS